VINTKLHITRNKKAGFRVISLNGRIILNKPLVGSIYLTSGEIEPCLDE
jgi:hypothetical protein